MKIYLKHESANSDHDLTELFRLGRVTQFAYYNKNKQLQQLYCMNGKELTDMHIDGAHVLLKAAVSRNGGLQSPMHDCLNNLTSFWYKQRMLSTIDYQENTVTM